jgi:hypothetical protein
MGKAILGIVFVAAAIAVPFLVPVVFSVAAGSLAAIAITAAIEIGISLASNALLGPTVPKGLDKAVNNAQDRLYVTMDTTAPRKILLGITAGATDLRYQTFTGDNQDTYWQVICVASHKVKSIDELWIDNEQAWTAGGGVQGRYVGYLTVQAVLEGTSSNGIAIDSTWTSSCTLTGCAYIVVSYKLSDNSDTDKTPFAGGVSSRLTIRCHGAYVYDPRLDSTVAGGSGSQRSNDQTTWSWSDTACRNPALQELFYELGWKINNKLAVGKGVPPARLDLAAYATAANACDESITLNGGGTEPRYRSDGVITEGDDPSSVRETMCATMNAVMRDAGGKISLTVLHNDLATPVASLSERDILGEERWDQTPDLSSTFNICRGRRVDNSDTALYQLTDVPEAKLTSLDGIDRIDTMDMPLVESNGQAQRLLKQRLERKQYQGKYTLTGGPKWWQTSLGDVIQLSHSALGWTNKLFRVAGQAISRAGPCKVILVEENAAIYAWDNSESAPVTPGAPTYYDPLNHPIVQGIHKGLTNNAGNCLKDVLFGALWTRTLGANRRRANSTNGYALGNMPWYCELNPSTTSEISAKSELVKVAPGSRVYFKIDCQRGTSLGTGSRLNMGHEWVKSNRLTLSATAPVEGPQQTPTSLTAGADPVSVYWSDIVPSDAAFVRIKPYCPARSSSSGTFRVEAPVISKIDLGGTPYIGFGPDSYTAQYNSDGTAQTGELPFSLGYVLYLGGVNQTAGVTWTYKVLSGGINSFTSGSGSQSMSGTGTGTLTVNSMEADSSQILITATAANGSTATKTITLNKSYAVATGTTGGGGASGDTPSETSGFNNFNSTTATVVTGSGIPDYTVPTGDSSITCTFNLKARPAKTGGDNAWTVNCKIQILIGATWTDVGTAMSGTTDLTTDPETGIQLVDAYTFTGTRQKTGLTAGTQYQWRALMWLTSGTQTHNVSGSISLASP